MEPIDGSHFKDRAPFKGAIGSSTKQLITDNQSTHAVIYNDDLLVEILLRLPVISLLQLKPVCKRWLSLISDPTFTLRRSQMPSLDPPFGLIIKEYVCRSRYQHHFLPFDTRIPRERFSSTRPFTFGSAELHDANILHSCNGLLLLSCRKTHALSRKYYVYNPCINLLKILPQCSSKLVRQGDSGARIAFDPAKSPHYKVIRAVYVHQGALVHFNIQIETYFSETDMWTVFAGGYLQPSFVGFSDGIYWNDALYWYHQRFDLAVLLFKLDINVEHQELTTIKYPTRTLDGDLYRRDIQLFETRGCLLILCRKDDNPLLMDVYEMKKGYPEWLVKYHVNLNGVVSCSRELWTDPTVYFIVLGERDEDFFMIIKGPSKIFQYKPMLKTSRDLVSHLESALSVQVFRIIASFAGVGL